MEIKTIRWRLDAAEKFDEAVNAALAEGWHLTKREVLDGRQLGSDTYQHRMLYAELIKPDTPVKLNIIEAMKTIQAECHSHNYCANCPVQKICNAVHPDQWNFDEVNDNG